MRPGRRLRPLAQTDRPTSRNGARRVVTTPLRRLYRCAACAIVLLRCVGVVVVVRGGPAGHLSGAAGTYRPWLTFSITPAFVVAAHLARVAQEAPVTVGASERGGE